MPYQCHPLVCARTTRSFRLQWDYDSACLFANPITADIVEVRWTAREPMASVATTAGVATLVMLRSMGSSRDPLDLQRSGANRLIIIGQMARGQTGLPSWLGERVKY